jgi:predicted aspartyl protease
MKRFFLVLSIVYCINTYADSPITSTAFYLAFNELPEINKARENGKLDFELATFLADTNKPIDQKLALVNALGWRTEGKNNRGLFEIFLKNKYSTSYIDYNLISSDEHLIIGYLAILDNYFDLLEPLKILNQALKRNPNSYSYNIIYGLALAQISLDFGNRGVKDEEKFLLTEEYLKDLVDTNAPSWCNIYLINAKIENKKSLTQDFRKTAKKFIFDYINLYRDQCSDEKLVLIPSTEIYDIKQNKIKLTKRGGVYELPVMVNGAIELNFILDSGASDVHIPLSLFKTLINAGQIRREDVLGMETYSIADGSSVENVKIILRKLEIGQFTANNVEASVGTDNSPLLLGQSFLQNFKNVSIDNQNGFIEITPFQKTIDNESYRSNSEITSQQDLTETTITKIDRLYGGFDTEKIYEYSYNPSTKEYDLTKELNTASQLFFQKSGYGFKRGKNKWLYANWTYSGFDQTGNRHIFYDNYGQTLAFDKNFKTISWYTQRDANNVFQQIITYTELIPNKSIKPE